MDIANNQYYHLDLKGGPMEIIMIFWEDGGFNSFETISNTLTMLTQGKYVTLRKYPAFRNHNFILQILRNEMPLESATFVK